MQRFADNFIPVIPVDRKEHTEEKPFCNQSLSPYCPCQEDETAAQQVHQYVQKGLFTVEEAKRTWKGWML